MSELLLELLNNFGFPAFVSCVLLYDKMKTNGSLKAVVNNNIEVTKNNNDILRRIETLINSNSLVVK